MHSFCTGVNSVLIPVWLFEDFRRGLKLFAGLFFRIQSRLNRHIV